MLPLGAKTLSEIDKRCSWTTQDYLLCDVANTLKVIAHGLSGKKSKKPQFIEPPKNKQERQGLNRDQVKSLLNRQRKEL